MSGVLLAFASAALLWPPARSVARLRPPRPATFVALRRLDLAAPWPAAAAAALAGSLLGTPLVAVLAGIVGATAARARRARRRARRAEALLAGLTHGLAALAAELRSGRSTELAAAAAVQACADEECGALLVRALGDRPTGGMVAHGDPLETALHRISAGAALSRRTGCSLAAVVTAIEDDLRARARVRRELGTAVAGPLAGARLLAGLPVLGLAMGHGVGAEPWRVLTETGTGQLLLVAGVLLELGGLAWSRAITARAMR